MAVKFFTKNVLVNGAMASTTTLTSDAVDMCGLNTGAFQMVWTGTPTGSSAWTVEVSNNYDPKTGASAASWTTLTLSVSPTDPAGSASNTGIDLGTDFPWRAVRLKYTNASGTGTLQVYFHGKGHG